MMDYAAVYKQNDKNSTKLIKIKQTNKKTEEVSEEEVGEGSIYDKHFTMTWLHRLSIKIDHLTNI
jgi:hypothetical protein